MPDNAGNQAALTVALQTDAKLSDVTWCSDIDFGRHQGKVTWLTGCDACKDCNQQFEEGGKEGSKARPARVTRNSTEIKLNI